MAIQIKDTGTLSKKFSDRAANAAPDYKSGVSAPRRPWMASAAASEPTWEAGVQDAVSRKAYQKGVNRVGDSKWQTASQVKGADKGHYADGVRLAAAAWAAGVGPYLSALATLDPGPKGIKGSSANQQRSIVVQQKLHAIKVGSK